MPKQREATWASGVAFVGGLKLSDTVSVIINDELLNVRHQQGDCGSELKWAWGRNISGKIIFNGVNADILELITGGTKTASSGYSRVRPGDESAVITFDGANHKITCAQGANVEVDTIDLYDENMVHYKRVTSSPSAHEYYHYNNGVLRFNVADTGKTVYPSYVYSNSSGTKLAISPNDLPSILELWAVLRSRNLNVVTAGYEDRDIVVHLVKVRRIGPLVAGAESEEQTSSWSFEFVADLIDNGDYEVYFPKDRLRTMILLEDYDGNNICDYDGELIGIGYTEAWG